MKQFKYIDKEVAVFEQLKQAYGSVTMGCSEAEVNELESMLPDGYHLPEAYREYLLYGGKKFGILFQSIDYSYEMTKRQLEDRYRTFYEMVKFYEEPGFQLPKDIFVINNHLSSNFTYFFLTQGENPPVYWWEEGEGGLEEISEKEADTFSDFLMRQIKAIAKYEAKDFVTRQIKAFTVPRGQQFWLPEPSEYSQGAKIKKLTNRLGFYGKDLAQAETISGVNTYPYLEELSGWKAIKLGDEIRFFPPSYESPEEKKNKLLEQQNKLEEKKQELAKVEKKITNFQKRIKNLSGSTLSRIRFDNPSVAKIKELEKDLRQQRVVKQNLEREITKLEKDIN